jgi:hypothetical protein
MGTGLGVDVESQRTQQPPYYALRNARIFEGGRKNITKQMERMQISVSQKNLTARREFPVDTQWMYYVIYVRELDHSQQSPVLRCQEWVHR